MENEVLKCIKERRSVRKYLNKQIDKKDLELILEAGTYAATGIGAQSPKIVVIQNSDTIEKLSILNKKFFKNELKNRNIDINNYNPYFGAPTLLIVFADNNYYHYVEDGSLVIGNLMLAAFSLGINSCWVHRAKEMFLSEEGKIYMRKWGLSDNYIGVGNCVLGYIDGSLPTPKERKKDYIIWDR